MAISSAPFADPADPAWLGALEDAGIEALQIREKTRDDRAVVELVRRVRERGFRSGRLVVNARLDLALAGGADGVHLPADEIAVHRLRARFGPDVLVGRSTHSLEEVERAGAEGADYVTFGPVWPTASKPGHPGTGLEALRRACALGVPVLALGGVTPERFEDAARAGAHGVAAIRMFADRDALPAIGERLRSCFQPELAQ